jgi:hypothetical protein
MGDRPSAEAQLGVRPAPTAPSWARPYASPGARAAASVALVVASAVGFAVLVAQGLLGPPITVPARDVAAKVAILAVGLGALLASGGLLGAAVAVPMWTHRCYRNLPALGSRGHLSPAWAAVSWFIPVANLVLPWVVLRDLWAAPGPASRRRWALGAWWTAWLLAGAAWIASTAGPPRWGGVAISLYEVLLAISGLLFAVLVRLITLQQDARAAATWA